MKAIIIDDELGARDVLRSLLTTYCPDIEIVAEATNVPDGVLEINKCLPDVVFLDIEMPEYNGFRLFDFILNPQFQVVFVTAYSQFAVRAFEVNALDYLLKPVDVDLLVAAVEKLKKRVKEKVDSRLLVSNLGHVEVALQTGVFTRIGIPHAEGIRFIGVNEMIAVAASGAYAEVHLVNEEKILVSKRLSFFEEVLLQNLQWVRVHRSWLINVNHIVNYSKRDSNIDLMNGLRTPISRDLKADFEDRIKLIRVGKSG